MRQIRKKLNQVAKGTIGSLRRRRLRQKIRQKILIDENRVLIFDIAHQQEQRAMKTGQKSGAGGKGTRTNREQNKRPMPISTGPTEFEIELRKSEQALVRHQNQLRRINRLRTKKP